MPRLITVSRIEAEKIGAITVMKQKLFRVSMVLSAGGAIAAAVLSGAQAASAATPQAPSWRPVLSVPGGGVTEAVVATGKTTGWAFLGNGAAYERTGATAWKEVAFPGQNGYVNAAAASSPSNVWAAFRPAAGDGSQVYRWNGRGWAVVRSFPGEVTELSVLGPDDVWAFGGASGSEGVFHFNGRSWAEVSSTLLGGSAVSDGDVWAYSGTQLAHYDGRKWTETSVAGLFPASTGGHVAPALTGVLALAPDNVFAVGVGWADVGGGAAVVLHFNGHGWSRAAVGPVVLGPGRPVSDGEGGLWMTSDTHENYEVLLHYSAGQLVNANEPFMSVASIPGTAEALGGNATGVATTPVVYQYS